MGSFHANPLIPHSRVFHCLSPMPSSYPFPNVVVRVHTSKQAKPTNARMHQTMLLLSFPFSIASSSLPLSVPHRPTAIVPCMCDCRALSAVLPFASFCSITSSSLPSSRFLVSFHTAFLYIRQSATPLFARLPSARLFSILIFAALRHSRQTADNCSTNACDA